MKIVVIDGQGGGMGRSIVQLLRRELPEAHLVAVGTNAVATSAMLKAGASAGATGRQSPLSRVKASCTKPVLAASSITRTILSAAFLPTAPALTVKSCA